MRITGGKYRGRKVKCPPGIIRPTMDRMRESFFSTIGSLENLSFLDLFSGSGLMALEAVSRGALPVHAVEKDLRKKKILRQNLNIAEGLCTSSFIPAEVFITQKRQPFSIIFVDPPFTYQYRNDLMQVLINSSLLSADSWACVHFPAEDSMQEQFIRSDGVLTMTLNLRKTYGRSLVYFYTVTDSLVSMESTV